MLLILPVQCKGVMELHMWVCHGVKGRKLLQSLHQLHDGLIILDDKCGTHWWALQHFHYGTVTMDHCTSVLQTCDPHVKSSRCWAALRPGRASEAPLFVLSQNWLCLTPQKPLQWLASSNFCCSYIVTIPTACWIIQPVLDACCSNESFMRVPVVSGRIWMASAIAMQRLKTRKRGTFKMSRPKASPGALYRQPATGLRLEKETTDNKKNTTFEWRTLTDLILRRWLLSDSYSRIRTPSSRSRSNEEYEVGGHKKIVSLRHKEAFLRAT